MNKHDTAIEDISATDRLFCWRLSPDDPDLRTDARTDLISSLRTSPLKRAECAASSVALSKNAAHAGSMPDHFSAMFYVAVKPDVSKPGSCYCFWTDRRRFVSL